MIKQYILHFEWHKGYRPHISLRPKPRAGQQMIDGGQPGIIKLCPTCSGTGLLHQADPQPGEHHWQDGCCLECEANSSWCDNPPQDWKPITDEKICRCVNLADQYIPPASRMGDQEANVWEIKKLKG